MGTRLPQTHRPLATEIVRAACNSEPVVARTHRQLFSTTPVVCWGSGVFPFYWRFASSMLICTQHSRPAYRIILSTQFLDDFGKLRYSFPPWSRTNSGSDSHQPFGCMDCKRSVLQHDTNYKAWMEEIFAIVSTVVMGHDSRWVFQLSPLQLPCHTKCKTQVSSRVMNRI